MRSLVSQPKLRFFRSMSVLDLPCSHEALYLLSNCF